MRETPQVAKLANSYCRITPAYAGNTPVIRKKLQSLEDHPRVCGKHSRPDTDNLQKLGSPPRMRETPEVKKKGQTPTGITPAYAGNTLVISDFV